MIRVARFLWALPLTITIITPGFAAEVSPEHAKAVAEVSRLAAPLRLTIAGKASR